MTSTTPLDNIKLTPAQVTEATGVPLSAVQRLCAEGKVPCENVGKGASAFWRIRTGDLQQVRDAHAVMLREADERRRTSGAKGGKASPRFAQRLAAMEEFLATLGYEPPAAPEPDPAPEA